MTPSSCKCRSWTLEMETTKGRLPAEKEANNLGIDFMGRNRCKHGHSKLLSLSSPFCKQLTHVQVPSTGPFRGWLCRFWPVGPEHALNIIGVFLKIGAEWFRDSGAGWHRFDREGPIRPKMCLNPRRDALRNRARTRAWSVAKRSAAGGCRGALSPGGPKIQKNWVRHGVLRAIGVWRDKCRQCRDRCSIFEHRRDRH